MNNHNKEFMRFEPTGVELSGTNLVEAGAGTGKTFSLALLYLRGVIELEADVDAILAVTFTNAAVAELKDRIRSFMEQALSVITEQDGAGVEPLIREIVENACREKDVRIVKLILKKALYSLDEAHIYTIHGFCQRVLDEYAFLTKAAFDTDIITDDSGYMEEAAEDFYRTRIDVHPAAMLSVLKKDMGMTPERVMSHARQILNKPGLSILADDVRVADLQHAWETVKAIFRSDGGSACDLLRDSEKLKRNKANFGRDSLDERLQQLARSVDSDMPDKSLLALFSASNVKSQTLGKFAKTGDFPEHALFDACQEFAELFPRVKGALIKQAVEYIKERVKGKKEIQNQRSFSDLLEDVHHAVSENGFENPLTRALRKSYRLGFIDEFQDTDQFQWEIVKAVFVDGGVPLFLIGDPKQAIYSFRGADVFSYIRAREEVPDIRKYWLDTNYRSSEMFVKAVNEVFSSAAAGRSPFLLDNIDYNPVRPAHADKAGNTDETGAEGSAGCSFVIWNEETVTAKSNFEGQVEAAVAAEIQKLLEPGAFEIVQGEGKRSLDPGDIAVLVLTHEQGRAMKSVLDRMNIPGVISRSGSVFDTSEAVDLFRLLSTCQGTVDRDFMAGTLVSGIAGMEEEQLFRMSEEKFETHLERFRFYADLWREKGIAEMTAAFFRDYRVYERLLNSMSGERKLTNLRHLVDLLHTREKQTEASGNELVSWFSDRTASVDKERMVYEMTLESDERAVKIVTVHTSKGLEYPVVFAPYFYSGVSASGKNDAADRAVFHGDDHRLLLDLRPENSQKAQARYLEEAFAEKLRLFYVAVTRAAYRCYTLYPAGFKKQDTVPACHFLEKYFLADADPAKTGIEIRELPSLDSVEPSDRNPAKRAAPGESRSFEGRVDSGTRVASYSSIVRHGEYQRFDPALKEDIIGFPRGAHAGNALHDIFETLDFQNPGSWESTVLSVLTDHNLEGENQSWVGPVTDCAANVLKTRYAEPIHHSEDGFRLCDIPPDRRMAEMEFYLKCGSVRRENFIDLLGPVAGDIRPAELSGWLHGFIDLVFEAGNRYYVLDWKSNYLGAVESDYEPARLEAAMAEHNYFLQSYIYTLAFHRYLEKRISGYSYDTHFGGVFYLFLRGFTGVRDMAAGHMKGIFFQRPDVGLIHGLSRELTG